MLFVVIVHCDVIQLVQPLLSRVRTNLRDVQTLGKEGVVDTRRDMRRTRLSVAYASGPSGLQQKSLRAKDAKCVRLRACKC